jgi:glycosyltransferase involved in cell wall biosynthesis
LKILCVDQTGELGGGELSMFAEITHMPHAASVLLFEDGPFREMLGKAGIPVQVITASDTALTVRREDGPLAVLRALPAVIQLVRKVTAEARLHDVIYANSQKAFVVGAFASALSGRPLVWRLRDVLDASHFSPVLRKIAVLLANWKASRVIVNSIATGKAFAAVGGNASKISVAYPGIDEAPFLAVPPEAIANLRAELGSGDAKLIGVFGRLAAWKGQAVFIDAIARRPDVVGVIVGAALFGEEAYAEELHRQAQRLGIADRIRFLGFRKDIPALMRSMDVVVHSSIAPEPFGRVVVEGMLSGNPVIGSAAGGVLEILDHGKTGWLFEPGNADALAGTLAQLLENPAQTAAIAQAGQAHACATFTVEATVKQIDAALARL